MPDIMKVALRLSELSDCYILMRSDLTFLTLVCPLKTSSPSHI